MNRASMRTAAPLALSGVAIAGVGAYLGLLKPEMSPPADFRVEATPERIARGRRLFALANCDGCHSPRDFSRFAGPVVEGGRGRGAVLPPELGLSGFVVAPNITPDPESGIGRWTGGEKIRAIRDGIGRDEIGRASWRGRV